MSTERWSSRPGFLLATIGAAEDALGLDVDTGELEAFAGEVEQYYRELAGRLENVDRQQAPEDRMYM